MSSPEQFTNFEPSQAMQSNPLQLEASSMLSQSMASADRAAMSPQNFGQAGDASKLAAAGTNAQGTPLQQSEARIEGLLKQDPGYEHLSNVYKELDQLRQSDSKNFGQDLDAINKKLHADGLLPGLSLIQDRYTGADGKDKTGYSLIADDPGNPGHKVGSEVSTSHPMEAQTSASSAVYRGFQHSGEHHHGRHHHRRHHHYNPETDSAEGGKASAGGYDRHLVGKHVPKGDRKELIDKALEKAGIPQTAQYEAAMNKIITRESGWNPNIVNRWDINARRGDPSKGLMQVIHSTFEQYRDKSLPNSQTDPMANTVAALRYMGHRYGHGDNAVGLLRVAGRSGGY